MHEKIKIQYSALNSVAFPDFDLVFDFDYFKAKPKNNITLLGYKDGKIKQVVVLRIHGSSIRLSVVDSGTARTMYAGKWKPKCGTYNFRIVRSYGNVAFTINNCLIKLNRVSSEVLLKKGAAVGSK